MASDPFKPWRVDGSKLRLGDVDPRARPFAGSSRERDDARLLELANEVDRLQDLLHANGQADPAKGPKLLLVLQGMDTSGKDGTARAVLTRCSPLGVRVAAFKAPSEIERAHDFLWRVHAVVPRSGEIVVFNRSHYEDVLVPVVEGWIDAREQQRRLDHINAFEELLAQTGTTILKCFLHISRDEQKERLQARLDDPAKRWKFQPGDLDARAKWSDYQSAYETALAATSTKSARWHIVPADSKSQRNLMIASLVVQALRAMKLEPPKPDFDPATIHIE
ncbi:PPK2 family polyphosphate kinase [Rivibacter subsaxonicus]|uniref:Polyphosphate:AMP phosphotransferase n=1 Tax=Rivibacter subsaxonicus TaxID=457575 RepID=A0A4Q7VZ82_9BURK|nr:PPK2 family polyphosphate kinase [Rivibacter subsaxonicus]RZU02182.1 polyphosphate:AMP phosphotransferase [Rivibacter subsaxonicus]